MPTTVQLLKGNVRLVADRTVKELLGLLVKTNCKTPFANICAQMLAKGVLQFVFTSSPSNSFTVLSATNLTLPLSNWTVVGIASNTASDVFQFTSQSTT